mmetsp:Transcript_50704/g.144873  ORF Transcript_50704/g.144873 Transcript_50704/m.144873 type:complete len:432 (+) Transcript_50704:127-1422(+)
MMQKVMPNVLLVMCCMANALNQADRSIFPVAIVPMSEELGLTRMQQGYIISSFAWGYMAMQLPSGALVTLVHPYLVLSGAVTMWSLCMVFTPIAAHSGSFIGVLWMRIALGGTEALALPSIYQLLSRYMPAARRTQAIALIFAVGSMGQLGSFILGPLCRQWGTAFYVLAFTGFSLSGVIVAIWLAQRRWDTSEAMPLNPKKQDAEATAAAAGVLQGAEKGKGALSTDQSSMRKIGRLLVDPALLAICVAHFGQNWTGYTVTGWLPTYLHEVLGIPTHQLCVVALPYLVSAITGAFAGQISDAVVQRKILSTMGARHAATAIGLFGPAMLTLFFSWLSNTPLAIATLMMLYACTSACTVGYMASHTDLFPDYSGLTLSVSCLVGSIPGLIAGPFAGWLIEGHGSWFEVFLVSASVTGGSGILYLLLGNARR